MKTTTITGVLLPLVWYAETNIDEKKEGFVHRERGKVKRDLTFPEEVIPDRADATVKDGILEVSVPTFTPR